MNARSAFYATLSVLAVAVAYFGVILLLAER